MLRQLSGEQHQDRSLRDLLGAAKHIAGLAADLPAAQPGDQRNDDSEINKCDRTSDRMQTDGKDDKPDQRRGADALPRWRTG